MSRLYNFRYPRRIDNVMEPWRGVLRSQFEQVVSFLEERDRELENHVNFKIAQGVLAVTTTATDVNLAVLPSQTQITALDTTVDVPANRELRIIGHANLFHTSGSEKVFSLTVRRNGTSLGSRFTGEVPSGNNGTIDFVYRDTPPAGQHEYTVHIGVQTGPGNLEADSGSPAFISVEDAGPTTE